MRRAEWSISPSFLRYWRAAAVSGLGTYVTLFALQALVVLDLDGTASDVGWLSSARWLPFLVFGLIVGAVVDGRKRLPLLVRTHLLQAVLLLAVPALWWLDLLSLPVLLVVVFAYGTVSVVSGAAEMSLLPRLLERRQLQPAHARVDGADAVASTAGPALGGALVSAVGAPVAVLLDSLSYLYSALTLRGIQLDEPPARTGVTVRGLLRDAVDGFRYAYGASGLAVLAIATHGWFVGNAIIGVVLAPYALRNLDLSAFQFGLVGAVGGVGAVLGAAVTTWVGRRLGTGRTIILCHVVTALGVVAMVGAGSRASGAWAMTLLMLGQGLYGLAMGMSNSHEMSYRQLVTPDELQARTNTTLRSLNRTVMVVVAPVAGILADAWGIRPMLVVAAAVFALVAAGLAATSFRNVRAPV
ncbi:MFS transporter [Barrientosiimonas endolithica]|uniref:MFS transporter n=1 Tax=Barrientosiimonas endolithica TaxID=1535208 RepID=A0ABM8HAL2_9MICO|nr:MFS transporter [Barrientosiimonas endolithica]BDZ57971.1 MFS transporter [Barrientosiimonas endolithica]